MGISPSPARRLIVESNRKSPISFAPGENYAQKLICFARNAEVLLVFFLVDSPDWYADYRCIWVNDDLLNLPPNSCRALAESKQKKV